MFEMLKFPNYLLVKSDPVPLAVGGKILEIL